jgi:hypothetical protein
VWRSITHHLFLEERFLFDLKKCSAKIIGGRGSGVVDQPRSIMVRVQKS